MGISLQRMHQMRKPDTWDDTKDQTALNALEGAAVDMEDTLHGLLSQVKRVLHGADSGNWYDDVTSVGHSLKFIKSQTFCDEKTALMGNLNLTDITVGAGVAVVSLDASNEPPADVIAFGASAIGAVCAQLAGAVGSADLAELAGANALHPKNLVFVVDASTGDPITSSERRIYGLLQVGSAATDGNAFALTGNDLGQITFVRPNSTWDDLELCPTADIATKVINYSYTLRKSLADMPESLFRGDIVGFDPVAGEVSLDRAYDGGNYITVDGSDVDFRLADTKALEVRVGTGAVLFQVTRNDTTGDLTEILTDKLDVNNTVTADFAQGAKFDTGDQAIGVGDSGAGIIDSTSVTLESTTGNNHIKSAAEIQFTTSRETAIELDDATAGPISGLAGGTHSSISAAIKYAIEHGTDFAIKVFEAATTYAQGANIPAAVQNLTTYPIDSNTPSTVKQLVFFNGRLLRGGNVTTKHDVYAGTTAASGDIKFDFTKPVLTGDVIISVVIG